MGGDNQGPSRKTSRSGSLRGRVQEPVERLGFQEMPIELEHGQRAGLLPGDHKDPFDRMLIAQAQAENMPVVSKDVVFDDYHVRRIW